MDVSVFSLVLLAQGTFRGRNTEGARVRGASRRGRSALLLGLAAGAAAAPGVDPAALEALVARARDSDSDALLVTRGAETLVETCFGRPPGPVDGKSMTKSVVNLALGVLARLGRLPSLDRPGWDFFPEWAGDGRRSITLRHLMSHTSGLEAEFPPVRIYQSRDWVGFARASPLVRPPGSGYEYNNRAVGLLAAVAEQLAGEPLDAFVARELLAPLGVTDWRWRKDPSGRPAAFTGLALTARGFERVGRLVMAGGLHEGRRLVPREWIAASLRPSQPLERRFGLLWWRVPAEGDEAFPGAGPAPDGGRAGDRAIGFYARGYLGNYLVVIPEADLVVVRLRRMRAATRFVEGHHMVDFVSAVRGLLRGPAAGPSR